MDPILAGGAVFSELLQYSATDIQVSLAAEVSEGDTHFIE
jgi:hypothetical protein